MSKWYFYELKEGIVPRMSMSTFNSFKSVSWQQVYLDYVNMYALVWTSAKDRMSFTIPEKKRAKKSFFIVFYRIFCKISLRLHIAYKLRVCLCMEILKKQSVDPLRKFGNLWLFWRLNVCTGVLPLYLDRITDNRFFMDKKRELCIILSEVFFGDLFLYRRVFNR